MAQDLRDLHRQAVAAAQRYMGAVAWPTVILVVGVLSVFVANVWWFIQGLTPLWLAFAVYAVTTYMAYTPVHEAAHGNINGRHEGLKWLNDGCGYLCATLVLVPYSTHRIEHLAHHRYTNQPGKDPDYIVKDMGDSVTSLIRTGFKFLWVQMTFLFREHWQDLSVRARSIFVAEIAVAIAWRVALIAMLPLFSGLLLVLIAYFVGALFLAYWFAYRPHYPYKDTERYRNTNSLIMPVWMKPLEWFWLGQNLHSIHHAFPRVPFYNYHALFAEIEPALRAHGNPVVGLYDRQVVAGEAARVTS